ncbi:MAG TPA: hypothetical protein VJY42_00565 [Candidatus Methanomethylophilaceae archaeon]|nr:hypothetical protein [Candidatus Methanomethylophilaceae archaeon]
MHARKNSQSAEGRTDCNTYSTGRAIAGGFLLSAVLWWVPFIGPAIAGYYSGRRSGSFIKGAISSAFAGGILLAIISVVSYYILGPLGFPDIAAGTVAGTLTGYSSWVGMYLVYFYNPGTAQLALTPLSLMIAFGVVGGSLSALYRREATELMAKGAVYSAIRPLARSIELYEKGKTLGFESFNDCISVRDSVVSINLESSRRAKGSSYEKKSVTSTVQTVTTTAGEGSAPIPTTNDKCQSPFSDILALAEVHGDKKNSSKK